MRNWTRRTIPSLFLCRKLYSFLGKSTKAAATRAAIFDSNMHQIVCRLGLCPKSHWGSLQRSIRPRSCIQKAYFYRKKREGTGGEKWRREEKWRGEGREEGREFVLYPRKKKKSRSLCGVPMWRCLHDDVFNRLHKAYTVEHSNSGKKVSIRFDSAI